MKNRCSLFLFLIFTGIFIVSSDASAQQTRDLYEIKIYHLENANQEKQIEKFLEKAYIPALERAGIKNTGVFKPIKEDVTDARELYVFIAYPDPEQFLLTPHRLENDPKYKAVGSEYLDAAFDNPAYKRIENIVLQAFKGMPRMKQSTLTNPLPDRIYELRSYESPTEKLYANKVQMFNEGEIDIFDRLGFNPVFYGEVIAGSNMPNLMYMTTFSDKKSRDKHWDAFGDDAQWKKMSSMEEYQNNVSHADIVFLQPTSYSKL